MVVWPSTEAGLKMECLSLVDAFGPLILRCCWPLLRLCFWHERLHKQDNKNQSKNNQAKNNNNLVIPTKTSSDAGGLSGFLTVNCVFSIRLLNSLVVAENTPSDAGRGFPSPHEFFTEHTKKNKKFSLSHCPSCSYHPDCPGAVALRRRGAFPDCPGAVALRRRELFPTAQGQSPSDTGSFFPFPKCPLATTAARCYGTSQLGQCHPRVTLTAGKGWQAPLDPPTGRQGAVPWDRALPRPRPYPGQGGNQPLHPVP